MLENCPIFSNPHNFYVLPRHFTVCDQWAYKLHKNRKTGICQLFVIDSAGDRYSSEWPLITRVKCLALTLFGPLAHLIASGWNIKSIFKEKSSLSQKIILLAMTPSYILGLFFSALYGVFMPWDGRKLYATLERSYYHRALLATCFQPSSDHHQRKAMIEPWK